MLHATKSDPSEGGAATPSAMPEASEHAEAKGEFTTSQIVVMGLGLVAVMFLISKVTGMWSDSRKEKEDDDW